MLATEQYQEQVRHELATAYSNLRMTMQMLGVESDGKTLLGWLLFVERSADRCAALAAAVCEPRTSDAAIGRAVLGAD